MTMLSYRIIATFRDLLEWSDEKRARFVARFVAGWRDFDKRRNQELENKHPPKTWDMRKHQGWGDKIGWINFSKTAYGCTTPQPSAGDTLLAPVAVDGEAKIGKFKFVALEYKSNDRDDLWFAEMKYMGTVIDQENNND